MALRRFSPDLDLFDPNDDDSWIGTWEHDDGSSVYGKGDPDMGRELLATNDASDLDPDGIPGAPRVPDPQREEADVPARPVGMPEQSAAHSWEDDVPPEVASALKQSAASANLDPAQLARVIKAESGWNPAAVNKSTGKHGGLIQFSQDGWSGVAQAAGRPEVTWDQMLQMSAAEQAPFVAAYYSGKGLTPESGEGEYHKATFMPAYMKEGDDFVLGERDSNEMRGNLRSGKIYEQNSQLDTNQDGRITNREVMDRGGGGGAGGGAQSPAPAVPGLPAPGGAPALGAGLPGQLQGMRPAEAQVRGVPLTPAQLQQRQQGVQGRAQQQVQTLEQAEALRAQGRQESFNYFTQQAEAQKANATAEIQKQDQIRAQAAENLNRQLYAPIQKVDPQRYVKGLSSGQKIMAAIGVALSAIGQAASMMVGANTPNLALQTLESLIQSDIDAQKEDLAQGRVDAQNRVAHWSKILGNAESGAAAARQEARQAAANLATLRAQNSQYGAEQKANVMQQSQAILAGGEQDAQLLADRENERLTLAYQTPKPSADGGAEKFLQTIQSLKMVEQELKAAGKTDAEIDQIMAAQGLARVRGETVPQQQAREKQEHQDAREDAKLDDKERQAEAAYKTLNGYAQATPLKRNLETGKWEVPKDAPSIGWKLENRKQRNAMRKVAIESFGRMESGGVISGDEEERFGDMFGGAMTTLEELAENLNALEVIIQERRKQNRQTKGGVPSVWE